MFFGRLLVPLSIPILDVDFSTLTLGKMSAASFLTATGLTFTRASASTVQTSASALDATPSTDDACLGSDGSARGLVLQNNVFQALGISAGDSAPTDLTSVWQSGLATTTHGSQPSPDGGTTTSNRVVASSNQYSPFAGPVTTTGTVFSSWQRSTASSGGTSMQQVSIASVDTPGVVTVAAANGTYQRLVTVCPSGGNVLAACDCRNYADVPPGTAPQARDILATYLQWEQTTYVTEVIALGRTTRRADRISFASGSSLVAGTSIKFGLKFYPKFGTAQTVRYGSGGTSQSKLYFLSYVAGGRNDYVRIDPSTRKVEVSVGGNTATSSGTVAWSAGDLVDLRVQVGTVSSAKYSVNGGAFTDLGLSGNLGTPAPSAAMFFCLDQTVSDGAAADTGQPPMRASRLTMYSAGQAL